MKEYRTFWLVLLTMAALSPAGLYLPELCKSGNAWGEWSASELRDRLGYAPAGLQHTSRLWKAAIPAYQHALSGLLGLAACGAAGYLLAKLLTKKGT